MSLLPPLAEGLSRALIIAKGIWGCQRDGDACYNGALTLNGREAGTNAMICETTAAMRPSSRPAAGDTDSGWIAPSSTPVGPDFVVRRGPISSAALESRTVEVTGQGGSRRIEGNLSRCFANCCGAGLSPEGGAVGYFAYDLKQHVEELPQQVEDDLFLPTAISVSTTGSSATTPD